MLAFLLHVSEYLSCINNPQVAAKERWREVPHLWLRNCSGCCPIGSHAWLPVIDCHRQHVSRGEGVAGTIGVLDISLQCTSLSSAPGLKQLATRQRTSLAQTSFAQTFRL